MFLVFEIIAGSYCSQIGRKLGFVACTCRFKKVSEDRLKEMNVDKIKKRTYAKMQ